MKPVVLILFCAAGCRATATVPRDDMGVDMAIAGPDLAVSGGDADLATGCALGPEICNNNCDDDRNGYTDADDPACTTQMLVTLSADSTSLSRLILEPSPHLALLDGNPVPRGGMATFVKMFSPAAYLAFDAATFRIERVVPGSTPSLLSTTFMTRDACVFNGELIIVEPISATTTYLHRFMSDGMTENKPSVMMSGIGSACASDGKNLFVARHAAGAASEIVAFDAGGSGPVQKKVIAIPTALSALGYQRIVDFAWVKKSGVFIGVFSKDVSSPDSNLDGQVMAPFGLDGGSGPWLDAGTWHGVGEFLP
jgi:hypothetical protein